MKIKQTKTKMKKIIKTIIATSICAVAAASFAVNVKYENPKPMPVHYQFSETEVIEALKVAVHQKYPLADLSDKDMLFIWHGETVAGREKRSGEPLDFAIRLGEATARDLTKHQHSARFELIVMTTPEVINTNNYANPFSVYIHQ